MLLLFLYFFIPDYIKICIKVKCFPYKNEIKYQIIKYLMNIFI